MGYQYRCSKDDCRARITLRKKLEQYVRDKLCPGCGKDSLKPAYIKERIRNTKRACRCDGYIYPHHKGTAPWCIHSNRLPTNKEHEQRKYYG